MTTNTGGPAFPAIAEGGDASGLSPAYNEGMTLRDYFAAEIAEGDAACGDGWSNGVSDETIDTRTDLYYRIADSMLRARAK